MELIKKFLYNGKVLIGSTCDLNKVALNGSVYSNIICEAINTTESHAVTVVGYDDNVYYDVNKNGKIEEAEKGAFKVANSWGTNWGNNGYFWVLYDALNKKSQIPNVAENPNRRAFFTKDTDQNKLVVMYVEDKLVNLVGEVGFNTDKSDQIDISFKNVENGMNYNTVFSKLAKKGRKYNGKLVFDLDQIINNLTYDLINHTWQLKIKSDIVRRILLMP